MLRSKRQFDAERLLRIMVFNRLCDPESMLGVLRWLEEVLVPDVDTASISHQHLLRTMDTLSDCSEALNDVLAQQLKPLIDHELSIVFYGLTTIRAEGKTSLDSDVRHYGPSKEGGIARQFMLGAVQTAEGLPIHHEVFDGNVAETRTLLPTIETVVKRFNVQRAVLVADLAPALDADTLSEAQLLNVSAYLIRLGRHFEAIDLLEKGMSRFGNHFLLQANLGTAYHLASGDSDENLLARARAYLQEAYIGRPANSSRLSREQRRFLEAIGWMEPATPELAAGTHGLLASPLDLRALSDVKLCAVGPATADRLGVRRSIIERMKRHGGTADIRSAPGEGTEVRLLIGRDGS